MYNSIIIDREKIQITQKLRFTYYELIKWNIMNEKFILYFTNFTFVMKISKKEIISLIKRFSVNIVSELPENDIIIHSFIEALTLYNRLII